MRRLSENKPVNDGGVLKEVSVNVLGKGIFEGIDLVK